MAYTLTNLQDDIKNYTEVDSTVFSTAILNTIIKNAEKLNVGEEIKIKLFKGDVNAKVSRIKKN